MNKLDIIRTVSKGTGISQTEISVILDGVLETISNELIKDGHVEIRGFGSFKVVTRAAREAMKPTTNERIKVPAKKMPVFRPSKSLKKGMNP